MAQGANDLTGLHVLVVEDEFLIAALLEDMLTDFGCQVSLAPTIGDALSFISKKRPDGVLLDMNIHGEGTLPVVEELVRRSVPFLLVTGYGPGDADPPVIKAAPRLQKPFSDDQLGARMTQVFVTT